MTPFATTRSPSHPATLRPAQGVAARLPGKPLKTLLGMGAATLLLGAALATANKAHAAWEPSKPVEFVVPAGTGGGADQMARFIQGVVAKHKLMNQPMVVLNKSVAPAPRASWT